VHRRGKLQDLADRLDPETSPVRVPALGDPQ
jgi:hypothetical protein